MCNIKFSDIFKPVAVTSMMQSSTQDFFTSVEMTGYNQWFNQKPTINDQQWSIAFAELNFHTPVMCRFYIFVDGACIPKTP